jgi:hypothetical protein
VPLVLGGTHELFLGRRIILRVLPPVDPVTAAGLDLAAEPPVRGSAEERDAVHRLLRSLAATVAEPVRDAHERVEPPPGARKRGVRAITSAFR